ncbi:hypothetical protein D5S17_01450 [Pseudonocardiaceae bacterium YIM PH 21723]|nr:hypothetical protein D5S17_01450 [Pseudonocardiaceae bacterium YIM PH 21723]
MSLLLPVSSAFGLALASALIPVISIELILIGLALHSPQVPWWAFALVIAIGQVGGKLVYFYAASGRITLPRWLRREPKPDREPTRWTRWLDSFRDLCERRPRFAAALLFASGLASLPPYDATTIAAGVGRVPVSLYVSTSLVGRFGRFALIAAAPAMATAWFGA